jgi:hypothetical protein
MSAAVSAVRTNSVQVGGDALVLAVYPNKDLL